MAYTIRARSIGRHLQGIQGTQQTVQVVLASLQHCLKELELYIVKQWSQILLCRSGGPPRPHGAFPQSAPFPPALDPHYADYMQRMAQQQVYSLRWIHACMRALIKSSLVGLHGMYGNGLPHLSLSQFVHQGCSVTVTDATGLCAQAVVNCWLKWLCSCPALCDRKLSQTSQQAKTGCTVGQDLIMAWCWFCIMHCPW